MAFHRPPKSGTRRRGSILPLSCALGVLPFLLVPIAAAGCGDYIYSVVMQPLVVHNQTPHALNNVRITVTGPDINTAEADSVPPSSTAQLQLPVATGGGVLVLRASVDGRPLEQSCQFEDPPFYRVFTLTIKRDHQLSCSTPLHLF